MNAQMNTQTNTLSFTVSDGVATLSIQRSAVSNAIDITIIRAIHLALDQIQKGESGARAVVITGSNDVFCSGLDLHSVDLKTQEARQRAHFEMRRFMDPLILRLSGFRFPIVAAVNGAAVGAGMSLALASDIIIAGENAYFLPSFARLGLVPDAGITFHLARRIGAGRSLSSLMLAERIDAKTALDWGPGLCRGSGRGSGDAGAGSGASACHRTVRGSGPDSFPARLRLSTIPCRNSCAPSAAPRK